MLFLVLLYIKANLHRLFMPCEKKNTQDHPKKTLQQALQDKEKQNTVTKAEEKKKYPEV